MGPRLSEYDVVKCLHIDREHNIYAPYSHNLGLSMGIPSEISLPTNKPDIRPISVGGEKGGSNSTPAV